MPAVDRNSKGKLFVPPIKRLCLKKYFGKACSCNGRTSILFPWRDPWLPMRRPFRLSGSAVADPEGVIRAIRRLQSGNYKAQNEEFNRPKIRNLTGMIGIGGIKSNENM